MKSRVYWNCLMNETILVQELHLPPSGLARLEEFVPIPKFIPFETAGYVSVSLFSFSSDGEIDDSFFQYHFLAQVAHRIILTRIRHSLYFYCISSPHPSSPPPYHPRSLVLTIIADSGTFPLPAVNTELHHQLEQWRTNLPPALQFADSLLYPDPTSPTINHVPDDDNENDKPLTPAKAITTAMLLGRYKIAKFHIGRPYLYKAMRIPDALSPHDIEQVRSGLKNAMDWPVVGGIFRRMQTCMPIPFAFCSQYVPVTSPLLSPSCRHHRCTDKIGSSAKSSSSTASHTRRRRISAPVFLPAGNAGMMRCGGFSRIVQCIVRL